MATVKRNRVPWVVAGVATAAAAGISIWLTADRGWLSAGSAWVRASLPGEDRKGPAAGATDHMPGMEGMPGMNGRPDMAGTESPDGGIGEPGVPGYAPVVIEPGLRRRIGVTVGRAESEPLRMSVKAVGIVRADETKTARVHLKTEGWVEELFVDFTGQRVGEGDPLLSIYSPEFLRAQEEYLVARDSEKLRPPGNGRVSLARSALQKLRLLDVPADELRELERAGRAREKLTLRSPAAGTVLHKNVFADEYVTPDRELYVISDLLTVWVQAKVYQYELPHVELGRPAVVTVPGIPGTRFEGKVVFIQPAVEEATRTVQVRVELPNPDGLFRPDMFVEVEIAHPMGVGLLVPASAVFRTGERDLVFRADAGDRFVPTEVSIGSMKFGERYHVLEGLREGDQIVTSANFLIDSESRLRAGGGGMAGMPGMEMDMPGIDTGPPAAEGGDSSGMEGMDHSKMGR